MVEQDIDVSVGEFEINVQISSVGFVSFVNEDQQFFFDGAGGSTYLVFNSSTQKLELWVAGVKQSEWGAQSGSPF